MKKQHIQQVRAWLMLAGVSLFVANCLAVLLVLSRMPGLDLFFDGRQIFRSALVLHVNLSLYVWLLSVVGMLTALRGVIPASVGSQPSLSSQFSLSARSDRQGRLSLVACAGGGLMLLLASLQGGEPWLINYFPVLNSQIFLAGSLLFAGGILLQLLKPAAFWQRRDITDVALKACCCSVLAAMTTVALTYLKMPIPIANALAFEQLFWGGGHVIQQGYLLLMLTCWFGLIEFQQSQAVAYRYRWMLMLPCGAALIGALIPLFIDPGSIQYRQFYTLMMRYTSWLAVPFAVWVVYRNVGIKALLQDQNPSRQALCFSILLVLVGFLVGAMIRGDNLQVPAHYHAVTGAINLAVMGFTYRLLVRLGYQGVSNYLQALQVRLYAGGLLLLVVGLTWSGVLGISRKVAGVDQGLDSVMEISAMALMSVGGGVALVGSFLFLGILFQAMRINVLPTSSVGVGVGRT